MGVTVVVKQAMPSDHITENIRINAARGLPPAPLHLCEGTISVCGNGPSLQRIFPMGKLVACLNGAWRVVAARGVKPKYIIAYDPAPENVAWFRDAPKDSIYILGSRMDPAVFEALKDHTVYIWHVLSDEERSFGVTPLIGGAHTVGTASLNLLAAMGYQHFNLFGYDSCWSLDGQHHAAPQDWAIEPPRPFNVGEKLFMSSPWMVDQVEGMLKQVFHNRLDYTVKVHDDGMLAAALEENTLDIYYDLDKAPGSFDFMSSLFVATDYAHKHEFSKIRLQFRNEGAAQKPQDPIELGHVAKSRMINNVVRPLVKMFGIEEVETVKDNAIQFHYSTRPALEYYREFKFLPTFRESREARAWANLAYPEKNIVTITLREASYWPQRNSNLREWVKFAKRIAPDYKVVFVRDTDMVGHDIKGFECADAASIDLQKRLALYRRAKMNFFVTNGPACLCWMTNTIPYINFFKNAPGYQCYDPGWLQQFVGIDPYGQMPWANLKTQRMVYKDDKYVEIMRVFKEIMK